MPLTDPIEISGDAAREILRVLDHHDTCKTLCDEFRYARGETCREYRERLRRIWAPGGPFPEAPKTRDGRERA